MEGKNPDIVLGKTLKGFYVTFYLAITKLKRGKRSNMIVAKKTCFQLFKVESSIQSLNTNQLILDRIDYQVCSILGVGFGEKF
jgi:hypothetical protein